MDSVTIRRGIAAGDIPAGTSERPGEGVVDVTGVGDKFRRYKKLATREVCGPIIKALGIQETCIRRLVLTLDVDAAPTILIERYLTQEDIDRIEKAE